MGVGGEESRHAEETARSYPSKPNQYQRGCMCVCVYVGGGGGPSSIPGLFSCLLEDGLKRALETKLRKYLLVFCSYLWLLLGTTLA